MIVGRYFVGDNWDYVQNIQHDVYGKLLGMLVSRARTKYLNAERILNTETSPGPLIRAIDGFDHRVMQMTHDIIAARFRIQKNNRLHPELPFKGQEDNKKRIETLWTEFWREEIDRLTDIPGFTRAVVTAVAFQNTDKGYAAEDEMIDILECEYDDGDTKWILWNKRKMIAAAQKVGGTKASTESEKNNTDKQKRKPLSQSDEARADVIMAMEFQGTLNDQTMPKEKMKIFLEQPFSQWPKEMQDQLKPYGADQIEEAQIVDTQKKKLSQSDNARATVLWNLLFNKKLTDDFISPEQLQTLRTKLYKEWPPELQAKLKPYGAEMIAEAPDENPTSNIK